MSPPLLSVGPVYKTRMECMSAMVRCGANVVTIHPHSRVVIPLPTLELQDDKNTHVFAVGRQAGLRTSLRRVLLKVDLAKLVRFEVWLVNIATNKRVLFTSGDDRDIELWNTMKSSNCSSGSMLELPIVNGFVYMTHEFKITLRSPTDKVDLYADMFVDGVEAVVSESFKGMVLRPEFTRGSSKIKITDGTSLLAYVVVLVKKGSDPTRISLVDDLNGKEIIGVPADVARLDAITYFDVLEDTYCLALDMPSLNRRTYKDAICVGGSLDMTTREEVRIDCSGSPPDRAMVCSWEIVG